MTKNVLIVAGGSGLRMGTGIPKQFLKIGGKPLLMHTINTFYNFDKSFNIILVLPENLIQFWKDLCTKYIFTVKHKVVSGGNTRFHSVKNGLKEISTGLVAIHDGVRPFVSQKTISEALRVAKENGNAIPVISIAETIRMEDGNSSRILDRSKIKIVQTPQVFKAEIILNAYQQDYNPDFTDDASVLEATGENIFLSEGNKENIKVTTPSDLIFAEAFLKIFED